MTIEFTALLKEIARGPHTARPLSLAQATALGAALRTGEVPDAVLGAVLIALRMKGETADELRGLLAGLAGDCARLPRPPGTVRPLVLPSYNGARRTPNLLPLLALMLRDLGVPVLIHGPTDVPGRTGTQAILEALGHLPCATPAAATAALTTTGLACLAIEILAPACARLLAWRTTLGVRNFAHTLVKLLDPFDGASLRVIGITHPAYRTLLCECLAAMGGTAVVMRGHEGEPVAAPQRVPAMSWYVDGAPQGHAALESPLTLAAPYALPALDAPATARYIADILAGTGDAPPALLEQAARLLWFSAAAPTLEAAREHVSRRFGQGTAR